MPAKSTTESSRRQFSPYYKLFYDLKKSNTINPTNWSLRLRFLTVPALLLALGCLTLAWIFHRYQDMVVIESVDSRLSVFQHWIQDKITNEFDVLLSEASPLSVMPEVIQSMRERDKERLVRYILPYTERLRATTGRESLYFHFHLPPAVSFLRTWDVDATGADLTDIRPIVVKANKYHAPFRGIEVGPGGAAMRAIVPLADGAGEHLGTVEAATSLENLLGATAMPPQFGAMLLLDSRFASVLGKNRIRAVHGKWIAGRSFSLPQENQIFEALDKGMLPERLGNAFYRFLPLEDFEGRNIGGILLGYDSAPLFKSTVSESLVFGLIFLLGAMVLWFHIYWNVARVKQFLTLLGRVLGDTVSGDFSGRFDTAPVHCLDILNCTKTDCPVYHDPMRICYLETGSVALSATGRNTCIFLSRYQHCRLCPVYAQRRGDELVEMRHTVNTLVRLWGGFMSQVGQVASGVLQTSESLDGPPSLGHVSLSLGYMAGLTAFGHDIQGVYNRWEVYNILSDACQRSFGLGEFAILELDADGLAANVAVNRFASQDKLCSQMFASPELCRAKRLGKPVFSAPNPALCPFFHVDPTTQVRCCLPMVMGGTVGGVMTFMVGADTFPQKRFAFSIIQKYLTECAPVLTSLNLLELTREQSLRDPLTGLHNRRFLDGYMHQYEEIARRTEKRIGFLMVDVDYFKQVNDKYGHLSGDAVLKELAGLLRQSVRAADLVVRFGGEEFLLLLHEVRPDFIEIVAEKIRQSVEAHSFPLPDGVTIHKTVSVGFAEYPTDAASFYKAIKFADVALYKAKEGGRNKVLRFEQTMWHDQEY